MRFIQFAPPFIDEKEIKSVVNVLRSGWLTMGPLTVEFENQFAKYIGSECAVAVNSCTAALFLSLVAKGIGKGDEVITSPMTFTSTANVVHQVGAKPVFADIEGDTFNIDPEAIKDKITRKTKAIIPVHYGGQPCAMSEILEIARENNLIVIEDAAHAAGAKYKGKKIGCGTLGDLTCFSFYVTKPMTTGEGGMITTNDKKTADRLKILRLHGIDKDAWKRYSAAGNWYYEVKEAGYKYNTTDINAAIGVAQLKKLDGFNRIRDGIFRFYSSELKDLPLTLPTIRKGVCSSYHLYPILLEDYDRSKFIEEMKKKGIGTSVHFIPLNLQPFYQKTYGYKKGDFPVAEKVYQREVSIPIHPKLTKRELRYIVSTIHEILR
jgi:dTDP-4-amino-4,6-dideoxygalactose transaminase